MKKFFAIVISLAVLAFAGYGIAYLVAPVNSVALEEIKQEISISCANAYIVRDETVYYATSAGTAYSIVSEGDRVSRDTCVSTVYNGSADMGILRELRTVDEKLARIRKRNAESTIYSNETLSAESEIAGMLSDIIALADEGDVESIHEYKEDINGIRAGGDVSVQAKIDELENERISLENRIAGGKTDITADRAGVFSLYTDGLESVLAPERIQEYTAGYIKGLAVQDRRYPNGSAVNIGDPICKVMNSHNWYVLGITDSVHAETCRNSSSVTVRFANLSGAEAKGDITYVSEPDENGECIFLVRVSEYVESAFSYRNIDTDIIFESYVGYNIPTDAIHTGDGLNTYYVYAKRGSDTYVCDCDVLYTDLSDGYSVICSSENAKNKLADMERLIVGER